MSTSYFDKYVKLLTKSIMDAENERILNVIESMIMCVSDNGGICVKCGNAVNKDGSCPAYEVERVMIE